MPFMFENLEVYKKAIDFADEISQLSEKFPKGNYYLVDQINRAVLSIATNIGVPRIRFPYSSHLKGGGHDKTLQVV